MDAEALATPLAAFVAGLVTSVHCVGMCGPLACAMRVRPAHYQRTRLLAYTLAGALCGALGQTAALALRGSVAHLAPWAMAAVLLLVGCGLERKFPPPRWLARGLFRARFSGALGWLTPLLPCGPLWLMFGVAVLAGSWWRGAGLMAAFAGGTLPLYWLAQTQFIRLQGSLSPHALRWTQQAFAFFAAALLIWRATFPGDGSCH